MPNIDFNFTPEQQLNFNAIYKETGILYPHLVKDTVMKEKVKVLIAYTILNNDAPLEQTEVKEVVEKILEVGEK